MARLNIKRRTRQVDDAREVLLGGTPSHPIHTTTGQLALNGDDKAHLSHNLRARRDRALIAKLVERVQEQAGTFLEMHMRQLAPNNVLNDAVLFERWSVRNGYNFVQDGLVSVLTHKGRVIATMTADVPLWARGAVTEEILRQQRVAKERSR